MVYWRGLALATTVYISITICAMRVKRHEVLADVKQLSETPIALRLTPGPLGIRMDPKTGRVVAVYDGQSKDAGVTVGMIIRKLDGADYTTDLLLKKKEGEAEYTIVLDRFREHSLSDEPFRTATSALHYQEDQHLIKDILATARTASYAEQPLNNELSRTASPRSDTHHKEPSFDEPFGDEVLASDDDRPASRDNQRSHGTHERLTQDSPIAKRGSWIFAFK